MSNSTDRPRTRLRAQVISPLPLAVSLMTGGAPADAAADTPVSESTLESIVAAPLYVDAARRGVGYSASVSKPAVQTNILPTCTVVDDLYATTAQVAVNGNVRDNDGPAGNSAPVASVTQGAHGAVSMDVMGDSGNGSFVYTPDAGFSGTDSFVYTIASNPPACHVVNSTATVAITVSPVTTADSFATVVGGHTTGNVLTNDIGSNLSVVGNTQPAHGSANVAADGTFFYAPQPNFTGTDSFQYTVQDGSGGQATGTVTLNVTAAAVVAPTPAASTGALGLLASLLAWFGLRRRREH